MHLIFFIVALPSVSSPPPLPQMTVSSRSCSIFAVLGLRCVFREHLDVFMTRTVHEVLWGYKDPILSGLNNFSLPKQELEEHFGLMWKVSE